MKRREISEEEIKVLLFQKYMESEGKSKEYSEISSEHFAKMEHLLESIPERKTGSRSLCIGKIVAMSVVVLLCWTGYSFLYREHKTDALFVNSFREMTVEEINGGMVYTIAQVQERNNPDPMELNFDYLPKNARINQKSKSRNLITEIYDTPNGWFRVAKSYRTYWVAVYHSKEPLKALKIGEKNGWSFGEGQFGIRDFFWVDGEYVYYFVNNLMGDKEIEKLIQGVK